MTYSPGQLARIEEASRKLVEGYRELSDAFAAAACDAETIGDFRGYRDGAGLASDYIRWADRYERQAREAELMRGRCGYGG